MSTDKTRLEIGHVLFIDIVGYSKLLLKQQSELLRELNEIVSATHEFREAESAGKLIRLPTGDGMALVFRTNTEAPVECAMEIARALKSHPAIQLRMGIHSGLVNEVVDVNQRANIAGAGINMAQDVSGIAAIHHSLRHVDSSAGDVGSLIDIDDLIDRAAVDPHAKLNRGMTFQRPRNLHGALRRCLGISAENQRHAVASRQTNQLSC